MFALLGVTWSDDSAAVPDDFPRTRCVDLGEGVELTLVWIRAGSFVMGSEKGADDEKPLHRVTFDAPFGMGQTEVTIAQWRRFLVESRDTLGTDFFDEDCPLKREGKSYALSASKYAGGWDRPMVEMDWKACVKFCAWLTDKERAAGRLPKGYHYSLPSEAQWEYACRAPMAESGAEGAVFCYGDDEAALGEYAWYAENSEGITHPVRAKKPNAWGLYGVHGNVWEWCLDANEADFYSRSPVGDPVNRAESSYRAIRGGGWLTDAQYCRSANRGRILVSSADSNLGMRVALVCDVQK